MAITQNKATGRWRASVYNPRKKRPDKGPYFRLKTEARADERRLAAEIAAAAKVDPNATQVPTVREWVGEVIERAQWAPTTRQRNTYSWGLVPAWFCDLQVDAVTPRDYDRAIHSIEAPSNARKAHSVCSLAFRQAVKMGMIPSAPTAAVSVKDAKAAEVVPPTVEQVVEIIGQVPESWTTFMHLAAVTGMRPGEIVGLQWDDLGDGDLNLRRNVWQTDHENGVGPLKTALSRRRIAIDPDTMARLQAMPRTTPYVFAGDHGNGYRLPKAAGLAFKRAAVDLDLGHLSLYDLRHFAASRLVSAGVSIVTVSKRLGHAKVSQTLDTYAHLMPGDDHEAAAIGALPAQ